MKRIITLALVVAWSLASLAQSKQLTADTLSGVFNGECLSLTLYQEDGRTVGVISWDGKTFRSTGVEIGNGLASLVFVIAKTADNVTYLIVECHPTGAEDSILAKCSLADVCDKRGLECNQAKMHFSCLLTK